MAPHPCQVLFKTILTDKSFDVNIFLKSGFNEFWAQINDYLNEFNKPQESGFLKRAKYADCKSILAALKKVIPSAQPSHFRTDLFPTINSIFCSFLHPESPAAIRNGAIELLLNIFLKLPPTSISEFDQATSLLIPWDRFSKNPAETKQFNDATTNNVHPIIDPSSPACTSVDGVQNLADVLTFISRNWSVSTKLCSDILFIRVLDVIYFNFATSSGCKVPTYGFKEGVPEELHFQVLQFFRQMLDGEASLSPFVESKENTKLILSIFASLPQHPRLEDFVTSFRFMSILIHDQHILSKFDNSAEIASMISDILCETIIAATKISKSIDPGLITVAHHFVLIFATELVGTGQEPTRPEALTIIEDLFKKHQIRHYAVAFVMTTLFHFVMVSSLTKASIFKCLTRLCSLYPVLTAAAARYSQFLAVRVFPTAFKLQTASAAEECGNFVRRKQRTRQDSPFDYIAENMQEIIEKPQDFVMAHVKLHAQDMEVYDELLKGIPIPALDIQNQEKLIVDSVSFISEFNFYPTLKTLKERENTFLPIISYSDIMSKMLLIPPGIAFDDTAPVRLCSRELFFAILGQPDQSIRYNAFQTLASVLNVTALKPHLDASILSQWYSSLAVVLLSADPEMRKSGFSQAVITIQHCFTGSEILVPLIVKICEEGLESISTSLISFLSSSPILRADYSLPPVIENNINSLISTNKAAFLPDASAYLSTPGTDLRKRVIPVIDRLHKQALVTNQSAQWQLLLPAYNCILADEMTLNPPNVELSLKFMSMTIDALESKSFEGIMTLRNMIPYAERLCQTSPNEVAAMADRIGKLATTLTPSDQAEWCFTLIRLAADFYIQTFCVVKCSETYKAFANFLYTSSKKAKGFSAENSRLMENTLDLLSKHHGRYPFPKSPFFPTNANPLSSDETKVDHLYATSNHLLVQTEVKDQQITISSQSTSGQFVWNFKEVLINLLNSEESKVIFNETEPKQTPSSISHKDQAELSSIFNTVVSGYEKDFTETYSLDSIDSSDEGWISIFNQISEKEKELPKATDLAPTKFRPDKRIINLAAAALTTCGRMSPKHPENAQLIENVNRAAILIRKANSMSHRLGVKIGVVYVGQGVDNQNSILSTPFEETSTRFREFITGLGWPVNLNTHVGYLGGLDLKNNRSGPTSIYFADFMHEMMFHIAPLLPTDPNDAQQIYKKRHIGNDHIHIIWCENTRDYNTSTITSQFNQAHIIIYPLHTALYRVDVFWRDELNWFGPLRYSTVVTKSALPALVRQTAMSAMIAFYQKQSIYQYPQVEIFNSMQTLSTETTEKNLPPYGAYQDMMEQGTK